MLSMLLKFAAIVLCGCAAAILGSFVQDLWRVLCAPPREILPPPDKRCQRAADIGTFHRENSRG